MERLKEREADRKNYTLDVWDVDTAVATMGSYRRMEISYHVLTRFAQRLNAWFTTLSWFGKLMPTDVVDETIAFHMMLATPTFTRVTVREAILDYWSNTIKLQFAREIPGETPNIAEDEGTFV